MFKDVDLPSLAVRMYNVMKNAKSVTKETAPGRRLTMQQIRKQQWLKVYVIF